jgi:glycine/D-amino acid oxidase-like deaminating enzyme
MRRDGLRVEDYSGPLGTGVFLPDAASLQPLSRWRGLASQAVAAGAQLFEHTRALRITGTEVSTRLARVRCQSTIVAVDGGLESIVPELAGTVRTARLQMLSTDPDGFVTLPCPVSFNFGFDFAQQLPDLSVALGGCRDRDIDAEWTNSSVPSDRIQAHLDHFAKTIIGATAPVIHRWAASVSYTTTGLPVLAQVRPGVWAIGGYNGTGNLLGALAGRSAARAACGEASEFASLLAQPSPLST